MKRNYATKNLAYVKSILEDILKNPAQYEGHLTFGQIAEALLRLLKPKSDSSTLPARLITSLATTSPKRQKTQLYTALKLPISVGGALMPDAHSGYGLPIGGVLAVENAVIPYGVGLDIGCRMCLSILDIPRVLPLGGA